MRFIFQFSSWTIYLALIRGITISCNVSAEMPSLDTLSSLSTPAAGEKRMVIFAPPSSNGAETYIKIIIGKTVAEDCLLNEFSADLLPRLNWGKTSFRVTVTPSLGAQTCAENTGPGKFRPISGPSDFFINLKRSSEPLVIDIPAMLELRYQRWDTCGENNQLILGTMCPGEERNAEEAIRDGKGWRLKTCAWRKALLSFSRQFLDATVDSIRQLIERTAKAASLLIRNSESKHSIPILTNSK